MRKLAAYIALLLAVLLSSNGSFADDLTPPDGDPGEDCVTEPATGPNNVPKQEDFVGAGPGRMSFCISDGNKNNRNELYVGGDFTKLANGDVNKQCIHIEVAGVVVWRRPNTEPDRFCH